jgi:ACT domain-containing protein
MIMLADIDGLTVEFSEFVDKLAVLGKETNLDIHTMHEDIFNTMHHI